MGSLTRFVLVCVVIGVALGLGAKALAGSGGPDLAPRAPIILEDVPTKAPTPTKAPAEQPTKKPPPSSPRPQGDDDVRVVNPKPAPIDDDDDDDREDDSADNGDDSVDDD